MSFGEYFDAEADHVRQISPLPVFVKLIVPLDDLYRLSLDLVPRNSKPHFGRFLLVCHKAFMYVVTPLAYSRRPAGWRLSTRGTQRAW